VLAFGPACAAPAKAVLSDESISGAVDDRLLYDAATPAVHIDVVTHDGIVFLTGRVGHLLAKERAERLATTVKGVRAVINRIVVGSQPRPDAEIRKDVARALQWDPTTEPRKILIFVDEGAVTLSGTTHSWQERELTEKVIKGVRGVTKVRNDLDVDFKIRRPDAEIREEIRGTLRWDAFVDDRLITISVGGGRVTLGGTVGSLAEKRRARSAAWVVGARSVNVSSLVVSRWLHDPRLRRDPYRPKTNAEIRRTISDALRYDPRVRVSRIAVEAEEGEVTLLGTVDSPEGRRAAAEVARGVLGVWRVENRIRVRSATSDNRSA
jgi:osmotically-inducible protein OsmY